MNRTAYWVIAGVAAAAVAGAAWWIGMSQGMRMQAPAAAASRAGNVDPATGRKVLYWHDPMVPGTKFDKPGKSPFMDMQLVPVYAEEGSESGVAVSSRVQQNLGVRIVEATEGEIAPKVEAVGTIAWNERDVALVQARANGFLEKLHVRAPMDPVAKGQALADLYVPDWVDAQEEYLAVARMGGDNAGLRDAAAQRMRLAGMSEAQVREVQDERKVSPRMTLTAPIGGVVAELTAREGMTVAPGTPLFRLNGIDTVWVNVEVPEAVSARVHGGEPVEVRVAALPAQRFEGRVGAVLPEVNPATRTRKVRVELANPSRRLAPGMSATARFAPAAEGKSILVPSEALIRTGERTVVMVAESDASGAQRFHPVDVEPGLDSGGMTEIRKGLAPGTKVVASGQFLLDSEASLKAAAGRLGEPAGARP